MASQNNKSKSTRTLNQLGLLSEKAMKREQKDLEIYFKEKVRKDRLIILKTLEFIKQNNPEPIIIFQ